MNKKFEQEILQKDQEIISLQHKLSVLDGELEKAESKLADAKVAREEGDASKTTNENLTRKIQLLEEELDAAEKNVKETVEKCVAHLFVSLRIFISDRCFYITVGFVKST